jgi:hypothetical protein
MAAIIDLISGALASGQKVSAGDYSKSPTPLPYGVGNVRRRAGVGHAD